MENTSPANVLPLSVRASLFLLSAAALVFEINLSRLFAVTQFYHFAFMIVSLALLGFGASGTFLAICPQIGQSAPTRVMGHLAVGASLSILAAYLFINKLPFDSFSIAWDRRQLAILGLHYVGLALPFFFSGAAVGMLLHIFPKKAGTVYATNLTGSALGCLGALVAPALLGGEGTVFLGCALAALASVMASIPAEPQVPFQKRPFNNLNCTPRSWRLLQAFARGILRGRVNLLAVFILLLNMIILGWQAASGTTLPIFKLKLSPYKSLSYALQVPGAEIISQHWNAFSRVDLVASPGIRSMPGVSTRYASPPPPENGLFVDGDNLSPVVLPAADLAFTASLPPALAFELRPAARILILEPVGGLDVLAALHLGAAQVTAVEPNPLVVQAASHVYRQAQVETILETGRSYLQRARQSFDIVLFSLSDTYHPVRSGAYSLAEDYRYTLESFQDALSRLDEDGILMISRWLQVPPSEFLRVFILAVDSLEQAGLDPAERIAALRSFNTGLLLVKKEPFSARELESTRQFASRQAFDLVYLPGLQADEANRFNILPEPVYFLSFNGYLTAPDRQAWLEAYPYDVTPPTDNHPFFGHYFKWSQAPQVMAELGKTWQPFGGAGYFVLFVLMALAAVMASVMILLPLVFARQNTPLPKTTLVFLAYFGLLGLAFLLVEIPLIQGFILYLGHPAYAFTTALFSLLLFSGVGSQNALRIPLRGALALLVLVILFTPWVLARLVDLTLGFSLASRIVLTVLMLAPLGFLLGIPFPRGVHMLETESPELIPWAWAVNGALSVIASILAAMLALSFGFCETLLVGAGCYAIALLLVHVRVRHQAPHHG